MAKPKATRRIHHVAKAENREMTKSKTTPIKRGPEVGRTEAGISKNGVQAQAVVGATRCAPGAEARKPRCGRIATSTKNHEMAKSKPMVMRPHKKGRNHMTTWGPGVPRQGSA
jgi:hypothetical protein